MEIFAPLSYVLPFYLYLRLVALFFSLPLASFAIGLRPPPLLSTSRSLSHFDIQYTRCFFLNTGPPFAYDAARSIAGWTLVFDFAPPFPPISFSPCVAYIVSMQRRTQTINTKPCFAEKQATAAHIFPFCLRVFSGNRGPFPSYLRRFLCSLVALVIQSDPSHCHSP